MRAFVLTGPRQFTVAEVEPPVAAPGQVVVDVERAGVCGTDVEFFTGHMAYLHQGHATYPMRLGHEWCGAVSAVGDGVDPAWAGQRVTGDTMLGCGHCRRCRTGRQHVCADRFEIGVRGGWPGALAEQLPVPVTALRALPDSVGADGRGDGRAGRQRPARRPGRRPGAGRHGPGPRRRHDRPARRAVRAGPGGRGPCPGPDPAVAGVRADARRARCVDRGRAPRPAVRRDHRLLHRGRAARSGAGTHRAGQADRVRGPVRARPA